MTPVTVLPFNPSKWRFIKWIVKYEDPVYYNPGNIDHKINVLISTTMGCNNVARQFVGKCCSYHWTHLSIVFRQFSPCVLIQKHCWRTAVVTGKYMMVCWVPLKEIWHRFLEIRKLPQNWVKYKYNHFKQWRNISVT